mmetsp:Transcript_21766/g.54869  ORF Transcript_21766/g.54869 Transcript_21766/m.54869 type:complete len:208 (+) Transcript_21766:244-867(+)
MIQAAGKITSMTDTQGGGWRRGKNPPGGSSGPRSLPCWGPAARGSRNQPEAARGGSSGPRYRPCWGPSARERPQAVATARGGSSGPPYRPCWDQLARGRRGRGRSDLPARQSPRGGRHHEEAAPVGHGPSCRCHRRGWGPCPHQLHACHQSHRHRHGVRLRAQTCALRPSCYPCQRARDPCLLHHGRLRARRDRGHQSRRHGCHHTP